MPNIHCNTPFLSLGCINSCINVLPEVTEKDPVLNIYADVFVQEVNIALVAYIVLFKHKLSDIKGFKVNLHLNHNVKLYRLPTATVSDDPDEVDNNAEEDQTEIKYWRDRLGPEFNFKENNALARTLRQYLASVYLQTDTTDTLIVHYGHTREEQGSPIDDLFPVKENTRSSWFTISRRFIPIISVTPDSYDRYFKSGIGTREEFQDFIAHEYHNANSDLRTTINKRSREDLFKTINNKNLSQIKLAKLAFFRCLDRGMVMNFYLNTDAARQANLRTGGMGNTESVEYYQLVKSVFEDLNQRPAIYHFVFATLLSSALPTEFGKNNYKEFAATLHDLWGFVKEMVYGVQELALNIIEHTEEKNGIITGRIYNATDYRELNPDISQLFKEYLDSPKEPDTTMEAVTSFFDFQVADEGAVGVTQTLLKSSQALKDAGGPLAKEIDNDIKVLEDQKIQLKHLLNPKKGMLLNQQAKRATAHFGLLTLVKLVEENHGLLLGSSWATTSNEPNRQPFVNIDNREVENGVLVDLGTNYQIVLPIRQKKEYKPRYLEEELEVPEDSKSYIEGIERLFDYYVTTPENLPIKAPFRQDTLLILVRLDITQLTDPVVEYWQAFPLTSKLKTEKLAGEKYVIALDLDGVNIDHGKLFRLIGNWELEYPGQPLILYNFPTEAYLQLLRLNKLYITSVKIPFWNKNSLCVCYSYVTKPGTQQRFFYTDVLWGELTEAFVATNILVSRVAFNGLSIDMAGATSATREWLTRVEWESAGQLSTQQLNRLHKFGIFDKKGIMLPFELLVTHASDPLFISNASVLLQNEIKTEKKLQSITAVDIQNYYTGLQGYKIIDSHFRIGSKIHISDFYYAKRFFQNSFFSSPLAYLIAIDILRLLRDPTPKIQERGKVEQLTLVGYGQFAELLLSLTDRFLKKAIILKMGGREIKINYDLLSETEDGKFLKNETFYDNIVVINPIASTFSTSVKIEEAVVKRKEQHFIFGPHRNLLYVNNTNLANKDKLAESFGLSNEDMAEKTIKIALYSSLIKREEADATFYLNLPANWYSVSDCERCFPVKIENLDTEKPLYSTDSSKVTPALIFGYPKGRRIPASKKGYKIDEECIKYGHYLNNRAHYLFYINIEWFYELNKGEIKPWLEKLAKNEFKDYGPVTIISPSHYTNTSFLNLVNEVLFSNAAAILHYDPESDFIQNFQLFYHKELNSEGNKIIFVDDIITTGSAFIKTSYFLQHTRQEHNGFDAAIILMDRSDFYANENILSKFTDKDSYFTYADIQLPSVKNMESQCPLCIEQKRYRNLAASSFLDRLKYHFLEQWAKIEINTNPLVPKKVMARTSRPLTVQDIKELKSHKTKPPEPARYIRRLDAINRVYQWFAEPEHEALFETFDTFDEWKKHLLTHTNCPFSGSDIEKDKTSKISDGKYQSSGASDAILKILTQSPFTNYQPVREKVFTWVLKYLIALVNDWETTDAASVKLNPEDFKTVKFLIRRAGQLNQNYLISAPFFDMLQALYGEHGIPELIETARISANSAETKYQLELKAPTTLLSVEEAEKALIKAKDTQTNLLNFNVFIAAQIKELLYLNEARSIHLEALLKNLAINENTPPLFVQLIRILREENGILLEKFWDYFRDKYPPGVDGKIDFNTGSLGPKLTERNIEKHYRSQTLNQFLDINARHPKAGTDQRFLDYLWLMNYLQLEHSVAGLTLSDKTEIIVDRLRKITFPGLENSGAFLIVKYEQHAKDGYFVAYNNGEGGKMNELLWKSKTNDYIEKFLNGTTDNTGQSAKTIIELYNKDKAWNDIYHTGGEEEQINIHLDLIPSHNHLLLIRINQRTASLCKLDPGYIENTDHPLGILGFFYQKTENDTGIDIVSNRYLLLLRDHLATFIHVHHENNEFKDWMDADRLRKAALLTGHGREMLINVANHEFTEGPPRTYKKIVSTIQMIQSFIIDIEREKSLMDYVVCTCKRYFTPKSNLQAGQFKPYVEQMITDIFALNEIENTDPGMPHVVCPDGLDFYFPAELLNTFLFELIVNAKKNRWLPKTTGFTNTVQILVSSTPEQLKIIIKNTGPPVNKDKGKTLEKLNLGHNTKKKDDASGVYLIQRILELFTLGSLTFPNPEHYQDDIWWFNAELKLNTWHVPSECFTY